MFKQILLPLDGSHTSNAAVQHAMALASQSDGKIMAVHVLENNRDGHRNVDPMEWQMRKAAATLALEKTANKLRSNGVEVDISVLAGAPADRIIEIADQCNTDLVILTRRNGIVGGEARKVVERIGRTILLVNPDTTDAEQRDANYAPCRYDTILAPLDGSPRAECVLPIVQALALRHHSLVSVANVVARPWLASSMPLTEEDRDLMHKVVARAEIRAEQYLKNVSAYFTPEQRVRIRTGDSIADMLHSIVDQDAIDLVVLSAHGATSDRSRPYGTIATDFVSYARSHVLIYQDCSPVQFSAQRSDISANSAKHLNHLARSYA